jgi:membrane associated rhomboid family serine protease
MVLITINVVVFLYEISLDPFSANHFIHTYGVIPSQLNASALISSMFLHGGWMHLIGNMWFLWIFGDNVEDVLGHGKYFLFYLVCGALASGLHIVLAMDSRVPMIGASGAIAGVMGAYMAKFPHSRILTLIFVFVFITTLEVPAVLILVYWFVIQLFSGVGSFAQSTASSGGTAWFAHVGGFAVGYLLIRIVKTKPRYRRRQDLKW